VGCYVNPAGSHFSDVETLHCEKLIVAAGMTSKPAMPKIDISVFVGLIFHIKEFGQRRKWLISDAVKNVTVVGGNKSSFEVARPCSLAGKRVAWLIRPDGQGPGIMLDARKVDKHISELGYARWTSILKPGIYMPKGGWYRFFRSGQSNLGF
jgi:dimethylaniline monooxygenase (N-oxide forming)